jgi:hypothetical protein
VSLKLYRPTQGGLEPVNVERRDWRGQLRARRWNVAPLENPEADPIGAFGAVAFFVGLAVLTFVLLLIGYGIGFWG